MRSCRAKRRNVGERNEIIERGNLNAALKYYELKINKEIAYKQGEAITFGNIAITYRKRKE